MSVSFAVRRATASDREAVERICLAIDPEDWVPSTFEWLIYQEAPLGLYVAEQEGRLIGLYHLDRPREGEAYFSAMRIDPAFQGQGLGSLFCRAQVEQARSSGLNTVYLVSVIDNKPAHRTVMKNGFEQLGEWIVWGELPTVTLAPDLDRARPATPADMVLVREFLARRDNGALDHVICGASHCYTVCTGDVADWTQEQTVVVERDGELEGMMLLTGTEEALMIRGLEGSLEAAEHLLAYASRERESFPSWSLGLPARCEPLLKPLGLNPAEAFRAFVFYMAPDKQLP